MSSSARTFKLTVAYDGTDFSGWQLQPGRPTIQGCLQSRIAELVGQVVNVVGSGRTDAGVHALAQVASCTLPRWTATATQLSTAINAGLPDTILVTGATDAADDFHAIRDAVSKRYRYQIQDGGTRDPFDHRYWHRLQRPVDRDAMSAAAERLLGRHDFACFQAAGGPRKSTVRTIHACELSAADEGFSGQPRFAFEVEADGFLYNMVRNIVGTLLEVGRGKRPPQWIDEVLSQRNRDLAGPTAPPHGLFLRQVRYR